MLDGVKLNRDPLAELRKLQEKYTYGTFVSPSYGGGTCNVEFEVLTGCPMDEVGLSTLPYSEMLHHEIDSLVSLMNENGYYSVAVHPNTEEMYTVIWDFRKYSLRRKWENFRLRASMQETRNYMNG